MYCDIVVFQRCSSMVFYGLLLSLILISQMAGVSQGNCYQQIVVVEWLPWGVALSWLSLP